MCPSFDSFQVPVNSAFRKPFTGFLCSLLWKLSLSLSLLIQFIFSLLQFTVTTYYKDVDCLHIFTTSVHFTNNNLHNDLGILSLTIDVCKFFSDMESCISESNHFYLSFLLEQHAPSLCNYCLYKRTA